MRRGIPDIFGDTLKFRARELDIAGTIAWFHRSFDRLRNERAAIFRLSRQVLQVGERADARAKVSSANAAPCREHHPRSAARDHLLATTALSVIRKHLPRGLTPVLWRHRRRTRGTAVLTERCPEMCSQTRESPDGNQRPDPERASVVYARDPRSRGTNSEVAPPGARKSDRRHFVPVAHPASATRTSCQARPVSHQRRGTISS